MLTNIWKSFGGLPVLKGVDLELRSGEVHAVLGENGAGKSTLMKIITGVYHADAGEFLVDGKPAQFSSPTRAQNSRVSMAYQEFALVPSLSVMENVFLGRLPTNRGFVKWREAKTRTRQLLGQLGSRVDPESIVGTLKVADQQEVEIARALSYDPLVFVMDEPSSALSRLETDNLYELVRRLRLSGVSIIYISHKLEEVFAVADRVTILRDGARVGTWNITELDIPSIIGHITGKDVGSGYSERIHHSGAESGSAPGRGARLKVTSLTSEPFFEDVSFSVPYGCVVGIAGVVGAGKSEVARSLVGALGQGLRVKGTIEFEGVNIKLDSLTPASAKKLGLALVSEDRQREGILPTHTVQSNIILPALSRVAVFGTLVRSLVRRVVSDTIGQVRLRPPDPTRIVGFLSGGNQQKVVVGKWLAAESKLLILDEPTRGIDVGAREEIYRLIKQQASETGLSVLVFSSDVREILLVADEILVMVEGRIKAHIDPSETTEKMLVDLTTPRGAPRRHAEAIA